MLLILMIFNQFGNVRIYTDGFNDHIKHKNVSNEIYLLMRIVNYNFYV